MSSIDRRRFLELAGTTGLGLAAFAVLPGGSRAFAADGDATYWHYPHSPPGGAAPHGAIQAGDWKLIEFYDDMRVELYNLRDDIGEQNDLVATEPARARELRERLHQWRASVGAQTPTANPSFDPGRP